MPERKVIAVLGARIGGRHQRVHRTDRLEQQPVAGALAAALGATDQFALTFGGERELGWDG